MLKCRGECGIGFIHDRSFFLKIPLSQCQSAEERGKWDSASTVLSFFLKSLYDSVKVQRIEANGIHSRPVLLFFLKPSVTVPKCRGEWGMGFGLYRTFFFFKIPMWQCQSAEDSSEWDSFSTGSFCFPFESLCDSNKVLRRVVNGIRSRPFLFLL